MRTMIIHEDADIIVVYKPAGLPVQTSGVGTADVISELKNYLKGAYLGVIHRLDQPVEGLLVFARNRKSASALTRGLTCAKSGGGFNKRYYAVLYGDVELPKPISVIPGSELELTDYIIKTKDNRAQIVADDASGAKRSVLQYRIIKSLDDSLYLADIHIDTGRFHQIRAQMSNAGLPIIGDMKYGTEQSMLISRQLGVRSIALCAYCLEFIHPATSEKLNFTIEPRGDIFNRFP